MKITASSQTTSMASEGADPETQVLDLVEELITNLVSGKQTDILIMDFSK